MSAKGFSELSAATRLYVLVVITAGAMTVAHSVHALITQDTPWDWLLLAVLTLVSGSATVKLPSLPATISVSETFVFTSVLLFGVPAGTLTVALDALIISIWSYRRNDPLYKIFFNLFALPLTIWTASQVFFSLPNWKPVFSSIEPLFQSADPVQIVDLLGPLVVLAAVYFGLNSWIIAIAIALERSLSPIHIWRHNFAMLSLNYFGGASVAALLVTYTRNIEWEYLLLIVPLLLILYFTFSHSMGRVADANKHLSELNTLYMSTIETLAMAIDAKDQITHGHIRRVQFYAVRLAKCMGVTNQNLISAIEAAALLHDMGKLAVPEYILNKSGALTPAEFERMKLHASVGADILSAINFPYPVVPIVRHHHENWDGSGYPDGLSGTAIPVGARILAVVDCFDALTSDRPYRPRLSDSEALAILASRRGSMYDPLVVDTFVRVHDDIASDLTAPPARAELTAITTAAAPALNLVEEVTALDAITASTDEMLTLFHLSRELSRQLNIEDAATLIATHLRRLVPCSLVILFRYRVDNDDLRAIYAVGEGSHFVSGLTIRLGEHLSGWVAANRHAIRNSDAGLDLGEVARWFKPRLRSCLSIPLVSDGALLGVLSLYSPATDGFQDEHQRLVEVVSPQLASILKQGTDAQEVNPSSPRDRQSDNVDRVRQTAADGQHGTAAHTSVILIEIEGQPEGTLLYEKDQWNAVLALLVRSIRQCLRTADFLFRHGGNSFLILLPQADDHTANVVASRIRHTFDKGRHDGAHPIVDLIIVTASSPHAGNSLEDLIAHSSQKLLPAERKARSQRSGTDFVH